MIMKLIYLQNHLVDKYLKTWKIVLELQVFSKVGKMPLWMNLLDERESRC